MCGVLSPVAELLSCLSPVSCVSSVALVSLCMTCCSCALCMTCCWGAAQVQENCIDLVGRIADRGAEFVPAREWMRICFELLEMLKAHKKGIRRATVNTFGYIAKAIGPQDVLVTLLNNLKVQERQNRVCTTVAIAIVAETCSPFTVLPALMNEYKVCLRPQPSSLLTFLSLLFTTWIVQICMSGISAPFCCGLFMGGSAAGILHFSALACYGIST